MLYISYAILIVLLLKTAWNIALPYRMVRRAYGSDGKTEPFNTYAILDVLAVTANLFAITGTDEAMIFTKRTMYIVTLSLPVFSVVHLYVAGFICGWLKAKSTR